MAEATRSLIADSEMASLIGSLRLDDQSAMTDDQRRSVIDVAARYWRARWVAEALDDVAGEWNPAVLDDSGRSIAQTLSELAAEYRAGTR